ncbi:insulinase family protein [Pedobacter sp. HMF7647]|uniref:Insulinase family protein n=1 Tax=Hufsiella arboris TaxID=2695275 RepID=A0A7K1Y4N3_9SPHI|nr:insulinase family protein [Hufsiella arboris]MXV49535.1 insulinase family protein [Hufsiella arboris]
MKINIYILLLAGSILPASNSAFAQVKKPAAATAKPGVLLPMDPAIKTGKLANGFTYYIRKNTEPKNRAQLYLVVKAGSILETDQQQGLAHFMEHMSFNGTRHYPKNELVNYLQKSGIRFGADLNAYTSFDETVYQLPLPTDSADVFKNGIQIMRDWAQDASLDPSEIDKERGVVLEEKRLGKGAQQRMQNKYLPMIFNGSRYSTRIPIGTEEVLKNFKPETIRQFYQTWYRPDLEALIVVGDINVAQVEQMIKQKFSDLKTPAKEQQRTKYSIPLIDKNQFMAVTDKEFPVTVAQILIKHPSVTIKTTTDMRNSIIRTLGNQMISARYSELSKQANPPFIQGGSSIGDFMAGLDIASTFVVARPGELEKGFKAAVTEIERIKKYGFTQSELDRAKEAYMTNLENAYRERDKTKSESYVQEYVQLFLNGEASPGIAYEYDFNKKAISSITLADVNTYDKSYFIDTNRDVIIMAPEKDAANLPTEATINKWFSDVQKDSLKAYVDDVNTKPLMAAKPTPGKIVAEVKDPKLGTTKLTLSNGVQVYLKPTDFKNDEIQFNAFSPGGTSLYSDADFQSADNASGIIARSGLGDYNAVQLTKYLAGKQAFVSPYIGERTEGINGFATPKDFETALQLVNLYFTAPRKDSSIFLSTITKAKAGLQNRSDDPNSVFSDTVSAVLGNYNIRSTGPSLQKIENIDLNKAYSIYKERFADAGDFTFTFVGSFDPEKIKPLLEMYLGSLPSGKKEEAKNLGIHIPAGKISKTVYKGQEAKATVRLVFSGEYQFNETNNNLLSALSEVLQIKLIERLREEESGVYSPSIHESYAKYPTNRYSFIVSFSCGPENVDKLIAATLDEINKIKQNGAQQTDINKYIAEETRTTETQLKENDFWLGYLSNQYETNENPEYILSYSDYLKKLSPQNLKEAANTYLSGSNFIQLVLMPEKK